MKNLFTTITILLAVQILYCQSVGISTTGVTPLATNLLEIRSTNNTASSIGIYSLHSGTITGTGYGLWAEKTGESTTNIAGYFRAAGATNNNNYAIIVPPDGGKVGIGTMEPRAKLDVGGGIMADYAASTLSNKLSGLVIQNGASIGSAFGFVVQNGLWFQSDNEGTNPDFGVRANTANGSLGTVNFVVKQSGNVGIGIIAPTEKLHVVGSIFATNIVYANNTNNTFHGGSAALFGDASGWNPSSLGGSGTYIENIGGVSGGTTESGGFFANGDQATIWSPGDGGYILRVFDEDNLPSGNPKFVINGEGDVGIGVNAPTYKLEVNGTFGFGNGVPISYRSRTETRNNAGLRGDVGAQSGMFETSAPSPAANWPTGATNWWHLLDIRHHNSTNNHAMQFAGSFYDQKLFFRKTNDNPAQAWVEVMTTANGGFPAGGIIMWSGTIVAIPVGWALCDGTNGTPNLTDRFILGAGTGAGNEPGAIGGANSYVLSTSQMPSHSHTGATDFASFQIREEAGSLCCGGWDPGAIDGAWTFNGVRFNGVNNASHNHSFTTDPAGSGASIDNRPLFYKLAYIIKL